MYILLLIVTLLFKIHDIDIQPSFHLTVDYLTQSSPFIST
jgi:hypothetical protein